MREPELEVARDQLIASGWNRIRLCVDTHHPIDPGNYDGPVHCTAHPEGHACVTALYVRIPLTTVTDEERHWPERHPGGE